MQNQFPEFLDLSLWKMLQTTAVLSLSAFIYVGETSEVWRQEVCLHPEGFLKGFSVLWHSFLHHFVTQSLKTMKIFTEQRALDRFDFRLQSQRGTIVCLTHIMAIAPSLSASIVRGSVASG